MRYFTCISILLLASACSKNDEDKDTSAVVDLFPDADADADADADSDADDSSVDGSDSLPDKGGCSAIGTVTGPWLLALIALAGRRRRPEDING